MDKHMDNLEEEEVLEPQITSSDPNERKLARQLRIQRRLQSTKKHQIKDDSKEEQEKVDERTLLEKQLDNSEDQLEKLSLEGKELITNVRVANDAREVKRREDEVVAKQRRLQRLENETNASLEQFQEVNSKWKVILASNDPLDLHHAIEQQKVKCAELIAQKDMLILELKKELKYADERFDKDQKKQKEDLWLLAERIDTQVKVMKRAYKQELKLIEDVMELERTQLVETNKKKWESLYRERAQLEVTHMDLKFKAVEEHENVIYYVTVEHQERFREMKIKLETDIQILQQELEQVKAQCLTNSEKLVYNFQVLKKREEENLIVRAQQKRRINRLQDMVNTLRKKIAETQKSMDTESAKLTEEIVKLHHSIVDIENKADHFAEVNDKKYHQLWQLNKESAQKLLNKILDIDLILHEQQLGLDWTPPEESLLKQEDLHSFRNAMKAVAELFTEKNEGEVGKMPTVKKSLTTVKGVKSWYAQEKFLCHVLKLVADNSDFLVEQRLKDLLQPHAEEEKMLIKIDNVFTALGVKTEADIMILKKYFLPYAKCTICRKDEINGEDLNYELHSSSESLSSGSTTADTATAETSLPVPDSTSLNESSLQEPSCDNTHPFEIEPAYVLRALSEFANNFAPCKKGIQSTFSAERSTVSRLVSMQDVNTYWSRFREIFSPSREKLWDGLKLGLQKYHHILEDRHVLNAETEQLRQQNAELRRLLHTYIQGTESTMVFTSRECLPPISKKGRTNERY